jgi:TPR repeat protein
LAQYNLGMLYYRGQGVAQNYGEAFKWLEKSAQQNHPTAQYNLAVMYEQGQGTNKDLAKSQQWIDKACSNGYNNSRCANLQAGN